MDYFEPLILCTKQEPEWEKSRQCSPKRKKVDVLRLFKRKVTSWALLPLRTFWQARPWMTPGQVNEWRYNCTKMAKPGYCWECGKRSIDQNWSGGPGDMAGDTDLCYFMVWGFQNQKAEVKGTQHLISWAKLGIVPQLVLVQPGRHFNDIVGLKLYDL